MQPKPAQIHEKKETHVLTAILPALIKTNDYSRKPLPQRSATCEIPRYDLKVPVPPRHVRLFIGEDVFCEQCTPLV